MPQTGVEHMGNTGHKMLGKELKSRGNRHKRLKMVEKVISHLFVYCGAIKTLSWSYIEILSKIWYNKCDNQQSLTSCIESYNNGGAKP